MSWPGVSRPDRRGRKGFWYFCQNLQKSSSPSVPAAWQALPLEAAVHCPLQPPAWLVLHGEALTKPLPCILLSAGWGGRALLSPPCPPCPPRACLGPCPAGIPQQEGTQAPGQALERGE